MFAELGINRSLEIHMTKPNSSTMKSIILALALVAVAAAVPVEKEPAQILKSEYEPDQNGGYSYSFESDDGIQRSESGKLTEVLGEDNKPTSVVVVRGSYSYINEFGKPETITYLADETGFHPEGDSIPKSPSRR